APSAARWSTRTSAVAATATIAMAIAIGTATAERPSAAEIDQQFVGRDARDSGQLETAAQEKGVTDDLRLLLDPVAAQRPTRLEAVVVAAERMPHERQIPPPALLCLPDMRHLVQEQALEAHVPLGEIVAVPGRGGVKMDVAARGHQRAAWLEGMPAPPPETHRIAIDRRAEHRSHQLALPRRQRSFAAGGA